MERKKQRGFVGSELFIVLAIFSIFCLIVAAVLGQILGLPFPRRVLIALGLFVGGIAFLVVGAIISSRRKPPVSPAQKDEDANEKPDAPPNP